MTTLLQINSSIYGAAGASTQLANEFVAAWLAVHPGDRAVVRDLAVNTPPHLDAARFAAFAAAPADRTALQREAVSFSDELIGELSAADVLVLGLPMYNYGVPTQFKAWFDHVARAGVTFNYTATGPRGALSHLRAVVFATRGGNYVDISKVDISKVDISKVDISKDDTSRVDTGKGDTGKVDTGNDHETAHLRQMFALIGISDVQVIYAEGLARSGRAASLATARLAVASAVTEIAVRRVA